MMPTEGQSRRSILSILCVVSLIGASATAHALSCAPRQFTLSDAYEAADSIIVGLITECEKEVSDDLWANGGGDCSFTSLEVLKEAVPARDYSGVTSSSGCGLSLHVGSLYLLFLDSGNQPMYFSAPLSGDHYQVQKANQYLRIIKDFRSGDVDDLAEPWMNGEHEGQCSVYHRIGGHQFSFGRRMPGAPQQYPAPDWTQETMNGEMVYKATVPLLELGSMQPAGEAEIVAFGNVPYFDDDRLVFTVSLEERSPAPVRQAALSVDDRTWSLNRVETNLTLAGGTAHQSVEYYAVGDKAEEILSAMIQPSDIVVTAAVAPNSGSAVAEAPPPEQPFFRPAPSVDDYFGAAQPEMSSTRPAITPNARAAGSRRAQQEPPEPVVRAKSRSTQLSVVIQNFRACYAGDAQ